MSVTRNAHQKRVIRLVLTGGPCGGKTTALERLSTFFESLGWKVYSVPETATILAKGGVAFSELSPEEILRFEDCLVKTQLNIEDTFFRLAETCRKDCLVICDRGAMDPAAYMDEASWNQILKQNNLNRVDVRDNRYNQVVHLTTAALGAEEFYTRSNNAARRETVQQAIQADEATQKAWLGHPYFEVVSNVGINCFDDKIRRLIQKVCTQAGVEIGDRLSRGSAKRKWLVSCLDESKALPPFEEFDVFHDFLRSEEGEESRVRRRGQSGVFHYSLSSRKHTAGQLVETRTQLTPRDYDRMLVHKDEARETIAKKRRTFVFRERYFQLDIYLLPLPPSCPTKESLMILETFTADTHPFTDEMFPDCLVVEKEVSHDSAFNLFNMALRKQ